MKLTASDHKRILITGSNGLVGQHLISELLLRKNCQILATSLSPGTLPESERVTFQQLDICDKKSVWSTVERFTPDVIIHAAAMTQVDPCEVDPNACIRVNVEGTRTIGEAAENAGARFIFLSSDFVFSGENGPYREDDPTDPPSHYGWSKMQGEQITRNLIIPWSIVRTILVYGVTRFPRRSNIVLWVRDSLLADKKINVVDDQFRMPTWAGDLAFGIGQIIEKERTGIFHLSGPQMLSVLDIAKTVARVFNLNESLISPISSRTLNQIGKRPHATGFYLDKAISQLNYHPKNLVEGLMVVRNLLSEA